MDNKELNNLFTAVAAMFWLVVFLTIAISITIIIGSPLTGAIIGAIVVAIAISKNWESWTINPDNQEIWYTKDSITGTTRFFRQGLNFKFPTEKRVSNDFNGGVIKLHRTITEEDAADSIYTCLPDNGVVRFDWLFSWWPNVVDKNGNVIRKNCQSFIKTDESTKQRDLRGKLEAYLTLLSTQASTAEIRAGVNVITDHVANNVFLPEGHLCDVEEIHGVMVGTPRFIGVLDTAEVQKLRTKVMQASLFQKIAEEMGKPMDPKNAGKRIVDEEVLVAAGVITKSIQEIKLPPGVKTLVIPGAKS